MKSGISISEYELMFNGFPLREVGLAKYYKSFRVALDDIKHISLRFRFVLDDDTISILITTKDNTVHEIPYTYYIEDFEDFETHFDLNPIYKEELKIECGDYTGTIDKIVYPKKMYWQDAVKEDKKTILQNFISKVASTTSIFNF